MADFIVNGEMFGRYVRLPYGHNYNQTKEKHIYKVVSKFVSSVWCEPPMTYQSESNPIHHAEMEDVLNVIHCGIDETKVIRVALKDCEIVEFENIAPVVHGKWEPKDILIRSIYAKNYFCSECKEDTSVNWKYCPHCGAKMDLEELKNA